MESIKQTEEAVLVPSVRKARRTKASECQRLVAEERYRLSEERDFWSECVCCVLNGGADDAEAGRAIQIADRMLEARRARFPV
jgi:hypothetical protein